MTGWAITSQRQRIKRFGHRTSTPEVFWHCICNDCLQHVQRSTWRNGGNTFCFYYYCGIHFWVWSISFLLTTDATLFIFSPLTESLTITILWSCQKEFSKTYHLLNCCKLPIFCTIARFLRFNCLSKVSLFHTDCRPISYSLDDKVHCHISPSTMSICYKTNQDLFFLERNVQNCSS